MTPERKSVASWWLAALTFTCAAWTSAAPAVAAAPAPARATAQHELRFSEDMIEHHTMAVHMGEMCLEKATHEDLKATCAEVVAMQSEEISTMRSWLGPWYGVSYSPYIMQGQHNMMELMAGMSAEEFEVMFLKMMIRNHWSAVVKASACVDRALHEELVALCEDIIIAQPAEVEQMRTWLCDWYGICNYGAKGSKLEDQGTMRLVKKAPRARPSSFVRPAGEFSWVEVPTRSARGSVSRTACRVSCGGCTASERDG